MNRFNNTLKPEYVLKRVNDLINSAVGSNADKEKRIALDQLHSIIAVKRKNVWTKAYENLMKRHLELCVDLKDHHAAKDGLHQYRNLCISVDPSSLETVILHLMDLSEHYTSQAKRKADKVSLAAANRVADLDQEESPESIMLSSMTEEGVKERTDREVVIPWLRFLWENYRAILELLYRLPKLEKMYHKTCEKAFKFCMDYSRHMEFRRLCEMLRMQLTNLQKAPTANAAGRMAKAAWEWTPEAMEYHLQTRFSQLEVATTFELWNEAFRTIEDINGIIALSKKTPKAKLMITYYEKLTRIFAVADNKLFHAYAWLKFYQWSLDGRKDGMKGEEKTVMASSVVLAAMCVPTINETLSAIALGGAEEEENAQSLDKSSQLATLLDFQANPSRQLLLSEIVNLGLLDEVLPELKGLYEALEVKFLPLKLIKSILPALSTIRGNTALSHYADQLERIAIIRVLSQLSRVYNTVKLEFLYKLFADLESFSLVQIERLLLEAVTNKQLNLTISHASGTVAFKTVTSVSSAIDTQAAKLGNSLNKVLRSIDATNEKGLQEKAFNRRVYISAIADSEEADFNAYNDRKVLIERRKEELERLQQEKAKEEKRLKDVQEAKRLQEEKDRQDEEERRRNVEKQRKIQEKREIARIQQELEKYNVKMDETALGDLDWDARVQLVVDAQNEALKAKEEENRKLQDQVKRLDYSVRAMRLECGEVLAKKQEEQLAMDRTILSTKQHEIESQWTEKHKHDLSEKERLGKAQSARGSFEALLLQKQREDYDRSIALMKKRLLSEKRESKLKAARKAHYEEQSRLEEERRKEEEKEENERLERERYERLRKQREEEEELERQREVEEERQRKAKVETEERAVKKAAEEEATRAAAQPSKPRLDPFGKPVGGGGGGGSDMFGGGKPRDEPARGRSDPFGGAAKPRDDGFRRSGPPAGGDKPDPFDSFKRGQKPSEEPPRRGGFDSLRKSESGEGGTEAPRPAGGPSKYVPPGSRAGGFKDEGGPPRTGSFRTGGDERRDDRRPPPAAGKPAGDRSEGNSSWR